MEKLIENFKTVVIPTVNRMIEKEKEHLKFLKAARKEHGNANLKFLDYSIDDAIKASELYLVHYELRVKEYEKYIQEKINSI